MSLKNSIKAVPLKNIDSSTVGATYKAINSTGLPNGCFLIKITNNSTQDVTVSYDGTTDHEYVIKATSVQISGESNNEQYVAFPGSMVVYVKGTAGTGNIYLSGYYQPQGL
jgi:uncharacterized protein (UPF0303 family)